MKLISLLLLAGCVGDYGTEQDAITQCPTPQLEGVDIYDGTGTIDWAMVKASGRSFAFIKATQGDYNAQKKFGDNWDAALAAGVVRSPYHFFDGTKDGKAQAQFFLDAIAAQGGLQPGDLPPMLDIECPTAATQAASSSGCEYAGNSGWVEPAVLKQRVFDFLDTVEAATGRKAIIYSYVSWFAAVKLTDDKLADYPLYVASYNSCATIPAPWSSAVFWQYSATTKVPGIASAGDVDRFFGTEDDLKAFAIQPPPVVPPDAGVDAPPTGELPAPVPDHGGCSASGGAASPLVLLLIAASGRRGGRSSSRSRRSRSPR